MKIAIIDPINQDIGLAILFPEADYFIHRQEFPQKKENMKKFNINYKTDLSNINDTNYDHLFIITPLYDLIDGPFFKEEIFKINQFNMSIVNNNNFKSVSIFDNYDYDYDPTEIINNKKINFFFKRNYNKTKKYASNVYPFPFFCFGYNSIIEILINSSSETSKKDRIFFTGSLYKHIDVVFKLNYTRDRLSIYNDIKSYCYNPGHLPYTQFISELANSKYGLDLNGVGDPNIRTFEILSQKTLRLGEYNDLKWPFEEPFHPLTIFNNKDEFIVNINKLNNDKNLYDECLTYQNNIFNKYFNIKWIKQYIMSTIKI